MVLSVLLSQSQGAAFLQVCALKLMSLIHYMQSFFIKEAHQRSLKKNKCVSRVFFIKNESYFIYIYVLV
jgi:hypothetical protein